MPQDLLHTKSANELSREINEYVQADKRALPPKPKVFAAIAKIQGFDVLPDVIDASELETYVQSGCTELNRGLSATKGVTAAFYAKELLLGAMYPGTLSAYGNGIYFATPSTEEQLPHFPRTSKIARKYCGACGEPGVLVRAALRSNSRCIELDEMQQFFREFRNKAKRAGIVDVGSFAAAMGYDAIHGDGLYEGIDERVYIVLNRGALIFQSSALLTA
jgi:hypothetical protein